MDTEENENDQQIKDKQRKLRPNFRIESLQYEGGDSDYEGGDRIGGTTTPHWRSRGNVNRNSGGFQRPNASNSRFSFGKQGSNKGGADIASLQEELRQRNLRNKKINQNPIQQEQFDNGEADDEQVVIDSKSKNSKAGSAMISPSNIGGSVGPSKI